MKTIKVEHDGKGRPAVQNLFRIECRGEVDFNDPLRWDWAGKTHQPYDVMRYRLKVADDAVSGAAPAAEAEPAEVSVDSGKDAAPESSQDWLIQLPLRAQVLQAAKRAVLVDRAATHGAVENSFDQLAKVWSARLGVPVSAAQVALMLVDLKVTRAWGNPGHFDNWVDIAGYAACGGEIAGVQS